MSNAPQILIVDDEPRMCDSLQVLLSNEGHNALTAHSGKEAMECLNEHNIDLVLLDVVMPDINGLQILDHIKKHNPDTLVIIITGHASVDSAVESLNELLNRVENAIEQTRLKKECEIINGKLQISERRYQYLVNNSPDIIYTLGLDGSFTFVNPAWERILGHATDAVIGKSLTDFTQGETVAQCLSIFDRIKEKGEMVNDTSCTLTHKGGSSRLFSMSSAPNLDSAGTIIGIVGILKDITDQRRLEAQLAQAQKMQAIGTLAGGIAHDFNNLLMGIQGRTSLMFLNIDSGHIHNEHLRGIENIVESGANLTKQLLGFARGGKYEVKPTDLNGLVRRTAQMFGRTKKEITIHTESEKNLWPVEVDRGQIEQVLLNLYVNAWHAMTEGGELYLKTENVKLENDGARTFAVEPGNFVKIRVQDTGVGMDDTTQRRIFEPFFTTKEMGRGTGLGLASAYGIIKNHAGVIDVSSKKGTGTTFCIYIPASGKKIPKQKDSPLAITHGTESILLVDDEEMIIEVGQEILQEMGYKVFLARTGKEAVEVYEKNMDEIDMVILDMIMPDMGGGEAYDKMKEIRPEVKVLLSSGYSVEGQASEILARGCNGFIQKPFSAKQLSQTIRQILDS
jgi:PAS domain S-box-containing protein